MNNKNIIRIIKSPHLGRNYSIENLEKELIPKFKGYKISLKESLKYKDEMSCDFLCVLTIKKNKDCKLFNIWYLFDRCKRITITIVEKSNDNELICPECGSEDIISNCSDDLERDDYDSDEEFEEAKFNLSDYECSECGREWCL